MVLASPAWAQESAAVQAAPGAAPLHLSECLAIAHDQQPALIAHRASLAAAQAQSEGLEKLPVPTFLRRDLPIRRKQACLGITIAEAGLEQAEWDNVYAVTRTYFGVIYAREQKQVAENVAASLRFYQERVSDVVKKGESREWTTSTVDKISVYLGLAETRAAEAARGIDRATSALREAMGLPPEAPVQIADSKLPTPQAQATREEIVSLALARRGELVQAATAKRVVHLEVRAQDTSCRPRMESFAAVVDVHARPVPQGFNNGEYRPGATSLEMPVEFAGPRAYRVDRARDLDIRAGAVVDKTRNLIALDAEDAFFKWEEAVRKVRQTRDASRAGSRLSRTTREDFTGGQKVRIEDILTNEVLAGQAQAAFNEAIYQQLISLAGLQRVTAGGFDPGLAAAPGAP
jgi:outer membrane protein TolC